MLTYGHSFFFFATLLPFSLVVADLGWEGGDGELGSTFWDRQRYYVVISTITISTVIFSTGLINIVHFCFEEICIAILDPPSANLHPKGLLLRIYNPN